MNMSAHLYKLDTKYLNLDSISYIESTSSGYTIYFVDKTSVSVDTTQGEDIIKKCYVVNQVYI